jgi:amidohydrolase
LHSKHIFGNIAIRNRNNSNRPKASFMTGYSEIRLTELRRELHRHPELSGEEVQTAIRISRFLAAQKPDRLIGHLGGTGVAAVYEGKSPGKRILVRCELDALPIHEQNHLNYHSTKHGVGHLCGHDGHMAMVAGLSMLYGQNRPEKGSVVLLFQPAEETGAGALAVLNHPDFESILPDYVIALHNLPGYKKREVVIRDGNFTGSVNSIVIKLKGKKAHAAEPMKGNNPARAVAAIIGQLRDVEIREQHNPAFALATPVYIEMGSPAYGVSADEAELHYTLRCRSEQYLQKLEAECIRLITQTAAEHSLELSYSWTQKFIATQNDPNVVKWVRRAAEKNNLGIIEADLPFSWGEDFGHFTARFPGALFGLGAGSDSPSLHQSDYDFPDDIIGTGVGVFKEIIQQALEG